MASNPIVCGEKSKLILKGKYSKYIECRQYAEICMHPCSRWCWTERVCEVRVLILFPKRNSLYSHMYNHINLIDICGIYCPWVSFKKRRIWNIFIKPRATYYVWTKYNHKPIAMWNVSGQNLTFKLDFMQRKPYIPLKFPKARKTLKQKLI